jgi:hypothetical protein
MGYPWVDHESKTLELRAANAAGQTAAALAERKLPKAALATRITTARASIAQLEAIADDATRLIDAGLSHADLIWMTEPDQKNNRLVITISKSNDELMAALANRYGTDLVEVRVRPGGPAAALNRDADYPAFFGGARWSSTTYQCTTGFAWNTGSYGAMITAAHCISTGGNASYTNFPNVGSVTSASEENWSSTTGTQYYPGQSVYRGDVALIRYHSNGSSGTYIYSGAPGTSTASAVAVMHTQWAQTGDAVASNGVTHGEWSGVVTTTGGNIWYLVNGIHVWGRNMVVATALGPDCPEHGDSGAPVYQKRADGKVIAFGILSGSLPLGVSCDMYFTDIRDTYFGLPGSLKVTG